jgi:cytochrome c553
MFCMSSFTEGTKRGIQIMKRGIQIIKNVPVRIAMLAIVFAAIAAAPGRAESLAVRNCTWCHGGSAQGYSPAPRLAGQRYQYIENALSSFHNHKRDNPFSKQYMWGAAANLSGQSVRDLAMYFSTLSPKAADDGDTGRVALGRTIYQEGMPDSNIVACVVCHGPSAEGVGAIPRLGGLETSYLRRRLEQWGEGYHAAVGPPMPSIASKLSPDQIEALASYLSFVR